LWSCFGTVAARLSICFGLFLFQPFLCQFDFNLHNCLSHIAQCSLSGLSWHQASLPFCLGGLGLRESSQSAAAAFVGSCNSIHDLASQLLSVNFDQLHFPDEDATAAMFPNLPISAASQHNLQAILDRHQYDHLFNSCSIRDCARLNALPHSSGTSSGWLKAIPQPSLGLVIPGPEFIVGLCIWLSVSFSPFVYMPLLYRLLW